MVQWLQIRIILKYFPICQNYVISVMAEKRQYNEHSSQVCFQMFQNPYIEEEQTTQWPKKKVHTGQTTIYKTYI